MAAEKTTPIQTVMMTTRATKCGDYNETGGGREDGLNLGSDDESACTYIGDTNYVALTGHQREVENGGRD